MSKEMLITPMLSKTMVKSKINSTIRVQTANIIRTMQATSDSGSDYDKGVARKAYTQDNSPLKQYFQTKCEVMGFWGFGVLGFWV